MLEREEFSPEKGNTHHVKAKGDKETRQRIEKEEEEDDDDGNDDKQTTSQQGLCCHFVNRRIRSLISAETVPRTQGRRRVLPTTRIHTRWQREKK
jgi:hypothetical protein